MERWCPKLEVVKVHGNKEERDEQTAAMKAGGYHICITTYETIAQETASFRKVLFHAVTRCYMLLHAAARCYTLLHAAARCCTLLHAATRCYMPRPLSARRSYTFPPCSH